MVVYEKGASVQTLVETASGVYIWLDAQVVSVEDKNVVSVLYHPFPAASVSVLYHPFPAA